MVEVKRYKTDQAYRKDAERLAAQGWRVTNVISEQPRAGCMRIILTGGLGAIVWKPKPQLVVTYER